MRLRCILINEIETVIKNPQQKKAQVLMDSLLKFYKNSSTQVVLKLLQKVQNEGILPNKFYKSIMNQVSKPGKDASKKESYRPISLVNIDLKIFNKILPNRNQKHIKKDHTP
jgi:hypothetical protein